MKQKLAKSSYKQPGIFYDEVQYPLISQNEVLNSQANTTPQGKSKPVSLTNYHGLLKTFMIQNVKTELEDEESLEAVKPGSLNVVVLAIEKRNGLCTLIAKDLTVKLTPTKAPQPLIKVLLCPLFTRRIKITPGTELTLSRFNTFKMQPLSTI